MLIYDEGWNACSITIGSSSMRCWKYAHGPLGNGNIERQKNHAIYSNHLYAVAGPLHRGLATWT